MPPADPPRVPLPLAQLRRRADNGKTRLHRIDTARYLWEAIVKLTASAALATYDRLGTPDPAIDAELAFLPRAQLGHWRGAIRLLGPWLAARDEGYRRLTEMLDRRRSDMPRCAAMAAVIQNPQRTEPARGPVAAADLLDRLVTFRNDYPGHGALTSLPDDAQDRLEATLRAAADEFLDRVDVLAGRRLVYVREVRQVDGCWLVERFELADQMTRLPSLEVPRDRLADLPDANQIYLAAADDRPAGLIPLHPLLVFDAADEEVLFLNGCKDARRAKYLGYLSGKNSLREDLAATRPGPLAAALGISPAPPRQEGPRPPEPQPPPPEPGTQPRELDEFELLGELGRGGMGIVYRARQKSLDREVALKVMLRPGDRRAEARFSREVVALGRVDHPNVVKVFTSGAAGNELFYVMELVEGVDLSAVIDRVANSTTVEVSGADWTAALSTTPDRPDPTAAPAPAASPPLERSPPMWAAHADIVRVVEVIRQTAEAAHALHQAKVIHRDIKPGNIRLTAGGHAVLMDLGVAQLMDEADGRLTRTREFVGTLRYASPEQLNGLVLDPRADVYSLGATLWELLTLRPLYGITDQKPTPEQINMLMVADPEKERVRRYNRRVPADLDAIVLKCLRKDPVERYATAADLAADLGRWQRGEAVLAQAPSLSYLLRKKVRRNPGWVALAVASLLLVIGGVVAAFEVQRALADERLAGQAKRADDRIAAEQKRQTDLRDADEQARQKQRLARAGALVDALATAETAAIPRLIGDLREYRDLTGAKLRELAAQPVGTKPGLHARLALLADEPGRAAELGAYLPVCRPDELLTIREFLVPQSAAVAPALWPVLTDEKADSGKRLRAACALAGLAPTDPRWVALAPAVAGWVVRSNPTEVDAWIRALEPVRFSLLPELVKLYPAARDRIRSGKIADSELAPEAAAFELTAGLLARYAFDRPVDLAELAMAVDARHHKLFAEAIEKNKAAVVAILKAELGRTALPGWAGNGEIGPAVAAVVGVAPLTTELDPDPVIDALAKRQANAAAVLVTLGEAESVWQLFVFPKNGDPGVRSYLVHRLGAIGADPLALIRQFRVEPEVSAKRALLLALGEFPAELVPAGEREPLAASLLALYREHPDPGLHGAIDWLLRQKWGKAAELAAIDVELAAAARGRVVARALADVGPLPLGPLLPAPPVAVGKDWFVNGEGQTFAVVRGPVEFTLGSPTTEPGRLASNETAHWKRISRTFAMATKEVTVAEFLRFRPDHDWIKRYSPGLDTPAVSMTWYEAAEYCNWLSEREGIPPDQWCYEPAKGGIYGSGMAMKEGHLKLTGYRLPTEAEWEYACRAGAGTARYFGRGEELLGRYGWFLKNADDRSWPVGGLKPNDLGLFDMLGNAVEWLEDPGLLYVTGQRDEVENKKYLQINEQSNRLLRGGSFDYHPVDLRCAIRNDIRPGNRNNTIGFRPARTLPP